MLLREFFTILLAFQIHLFNAESISDIKDTKDDPVDILKLEHIKINGYTGPMTAEVLHLFKNVKTLLLENSTFTFLRDNLYDAVPKLEKITLFNCVIIKRKEVKISHCCRRLKDISLINTSLPEVPWHQIGGEWSTERIYVSNENVYELKANLLTDVELKELTIRESGLTIIDNGTFNDLTLLETLNLEGNKIKAIHKNILQPLRNLKHLDLSHNLLRKLTTDHFPSLPNLEELDVSYNPIEEINLEGIKELAPKLEKVDISGIDGIDLSKIGGVTFVKKDVA